MVRARARGVDRVRLGSGHGGGQHLAIFRKPKVFSKSSRILTIEHLALERVGLVLGPTDVLQFEFECCRSVSQTRPCFTNRITCMSHGRSRSF